VARSNLSLQYKVCSVNQFDFGYIYLPVFFGGGGSRTTKTRRPDKEFYRKQMAYTKQRAPAVTSGRQASKESATRWEGPLCAFFCSLRGRGAQAAAERADDLVGDDLRRGLDGPVGLRP
jgi:hypothetical protein